ncbi:MAG: glucosidase [Acidobacteria bacterium]|nr:MAG: glucosidase [Acidobacteriota bacterium]
MSSAPQNPEQLRLSEAKQNGTPWRKWGPYLSERQWGTVREDYSVTGDAWDYFTHDQARSRAYRWGEDGLAGISDDQQLLCFALALWNGRDPILKERLFGLTNSEGNHGEDVKEYYFYLDSTPTHSYMKYLYKYPQCAYPYEDLVRANRKRTRNDFEYELLDTGAFDENRYFDVFVEYAKKSPEDVLVAITISNRAAEPATLHLLPTLWFRNTWSGSEGEARPLLKRGDSPRNVATIQASHQTLPSYFLYADGAPDLLFTENETNNERLWRGSNQTPYVKDAFHNYLISGNKRVVNPKQFGTKAAALYKCNVAAGQSQVIRLRLTTIEPGRLLESLKEPDPFAKEFTGTLDLRRHEADEFYRSITPTTTNDDQQQVMRQALAGMLWTKQFYFLDASKWLQEHEESPSPTPASVLRNREWYHMVNADVMSMPDKWEYPWYAAWDLAFHTIPLGIVDLDFAKHQLELVLNAMYLHPSGQIPAYEWNFSDTNPPVHALAALFLYETEKQQRGEGDLEFLKRAFNKLLFNFTWWVNRKDSDGRNVFEGGFLGLDNIGVFDRSAALPTGGHIEQADGTAWMALFSQNMLQIAVELATYDPSYEELVVKFCEHFFWIASAINGVSQNGLWNEEDGFYYDMLRLPNSKGYPMKVRSIVGILPLCATTIVEKQSRDRLPRAVEHIRQRLLRMPRLASAIHPTGAGYNGVAERGILALVAPERLRRILSKLLDENEFLSPYGIRALSRYHLEHPYVVHVHGEEFRVDYLPAESNSGMFGGNSNWRGPIWMPVNLLLIRALLQFYLYYGDNFKVECPTGSGKLMNLFEVSREIGNRLIGIFTRDASGRRAVYGGTEKFQTDPHWRDHILFYEYFHGDNGAGLGASHQTGWTGAVASLIRLYGNIDAAAYLQAGKLTGLKGKVVVSSAA